MRLGHIFNDDLAFFIPEDAGLLKATSGFDWRQMISSFSDKKVVACHFFNEDRGWIITDTSIGTNGGTYKFYYTEDGGESISLEYSINSDAVEQNSNGGIHSVFYVNESLGYISTWNGQVNRINNGSLENFDDIYPEISYVVGDQYNLPKITSDGIIFLHKFYAPNIIRVHINLVQRL